MISEPDIPSRHSPVLLATSQIKRDLVRDVPRDIALLVPRGEYVQPRMDRVGGYGEVGHLELPAVPSLPLGSHNRRTAAAFRTQPTNILAKQTDWQSKRDFSLAPTGCCSRFGTPLTTFVHFAKVDQDRATLTRPFLFSFQRCQHCSRS